MGIGADTTALDKKLADSANKAAQSAQAAADKATAAVEATAQNFQNKMALAARSLIPAVGGALVVAVSSAGVSEKLADQLKKGVAVVSGGAMIGSQVGGVFGPLGKAVGAAVGGGLSLALNAFLAKAKKAKEEAQAEAVRLMEQNDRLAEARKMQLGDGNPQTAIDIAQSVVNERRAEAIRRQRARADFEAAPYTEEQKRDNRYLEAWSELNKAAVAAGESLAEAVRVRDEINAHQGGINAAAAHEKANQDFVDAANAITEQSEEYRKTFERFEKEREAEAQTTKDLVDELRRLVEARDEGGLESWAEKARAAIANESVGVDQEKQLIDLFQKSLAYLQSIDKNTEPEDTVGAGLVKEKRDPAAGLNVVQLQDARRILDRGRALRDAQRDGFSSMEIERQQHHLTQSVRIGANRGLNADQIERLIQNAGFDGFNIERSLDSLPKDIVNKLIANGAKFVYQK